MKHFHRLHWCRSDFIFLFILKKHYLGAQTIAFEHMYSCIQSFTFFFFFKTWQLNVSVASAYHVSVPDTFNCHVFKTIM